MKPKPHSAQASGQPSTGLGLDDVYFTLFRHKVVIVTFLCIGVMGVLVARMVTKPIYSSQAKLLVRYVVDRKDVAPVDQQGTAVVDTYTESVLIAETEILTSLDLAEDVARAVGPEKILAFREGGTGVMDAAGMVRAGIAVYSPRRSDVMYVTYFHPDQAVVQPVLEAVINAYLLKHRAIRMSTEFDEQHYSDQLVQLRKRLASTEQEIKQVLTNAKVMVSFDETKATYAKHIQKLTEQLLEAKSQLYSLNSTMADAVLTNNATAAETLIPAEKLEFYANVLAGLNELRKRERDLIVQGYREAHPQIHAIRQSMEELRTTKAGLEEEYPGLKLNEHSVASADFGAEQAQVRALAAKIKGHENLLSSLQGEVLGLLDVEPRMKELERQRIQELRNFEHVAANLDKARAAVLGGNRVTGINIVEKPTPPYPTNKKLQKLTKMILGGCVALAFGIAILIDYVLDRTIKRSVDVRRHMRLPLFLSIPHTGWDKGGFKIPGVSLHKLLPHKTTNGKPMTKAVATRLPPWDPTHHLRLYTEGLRERLITNFEVNAVTHKPKLIGVTSCGPGAGTSTLSTGLAAALSKTGDGNVLLVDMNSKSSEATTAFYKGKPHIGHETILGSGLRSTIRLGDAEEAAETSDSQVENGAESESLMVTTQFNKFMPELKASDYDYVVFDMPPVTPTSATPRLAGSMDKVLLVIEAEKTPQQTAHEASVLLEDARANAAVVLNKCKRHVPKTLSPEL